MRPSTAAPHACVWVGLGGEGGLEGVSGVSTVAFPCMHLVGELAAVIASGRLPQVLQMLAAVQLFYLKIYLFI